MPASREFCLKNNLSCTELEEMAKTLAKPFGGLYDRICMSTEFFLKNCRLLEERFPELLRKILDEKRPDSLPAESRLEFPHGSQSGLESIINKKHLYVLYGLGDVEYALRVLQNPLVHELLIFEPSLNLLRQMMNTDNLSQLLNDQRVALIAGADANYYIGEIESYFAQKAFRYYYSGFFGNLITPGCHRIPGYQDHFLKFAEAFKTAVQNYTNKIKMCPAEDNFRGLMNSLVNDQNYAGFVPLTRFSGFAKNISGVLVGSGPSLKESLPFLKKIKDQVLICSCDSTLKTLLAEGIEPHFVCCLERMQENTRYFSGLSLEIKSYLIAPLTAHPRLFANYPGPKLSIHRCIGFEKWLFPDEKQFFLGSMVSHLGLVSLAILGCSEICLLGMDGAFSPEDKERYYSDLATTDLHAVAGHAQKMQRDLIFEQAGHDGQPKRTSYYLYESLQYFSQIIKEHGLKVTNVIPKKFGLPILGATQCDPLQMPEFKNSGLTALWSQISQSHEREKARNKWEPERLKTGYDFLTWLKERALEDLHDMSHFLMENYPDVPDKVPLYGKYFELVEQRRLKIMNHPSGLFHQIMVPVILNEHALIEFGLRQILAQENTEAEKIVQQMVGYMDWYKSILFWGERSRHAIRNCLPKGS